MTSNQEFAALALGRADQHPAGSLERRAWACIGVAFSVTKTVQAAHRPSTPETTMTTDPAPAAPRVIGVAATHAATAVALPDGTVETIPARSPDGDLRLGQLAARLTRLGSVSWIMCGARSRGWRR